MKLYTIWRRGPDEAPHLITATDGTTTDANGFDGRYLEMLAHPHVRELVVEIPDDAVTRLFETPVQAAMKTTDPQAVLEKVRAIYEKMRYDRSYAGYQDEMKAVLEGADES